MKKFSIKKIHIFVIVMVVLSVIVCGKSYFFPEPDEPIPHSDWVKKWLESPSCSPPCWENITPGVTSILKAQELLPQVPEVTSVGKLYEPDKFRWYELNWEMKGGGGGARTFLDSEVISDIGFGIMNHQLIIQEVVDAYGEPSDLMVYDCELHISLVCSIDLMIMEKGISMSLSREVKNGKIVIQANDVISVFYLFPSGKEGYQRTLGKYIDWSVNKTIEWQGYGEYPAPLN